MCTGLVSDAEARCQCHEVSGIARQSCGQALIARIYTVDPAVDHDECMSMYNAGGMSTLELKKTSC